MRDSRDSSMKELVFSTFANIYIFVLLAAARVVHHAKQEIKEMWRMSEKMKEELVGV